MEPFFHSHRFADVILNANYSIKQEIEQVVRSLQLENIERRFKKENKEKLSLGGTLAKGMQSTINAMLRDEFRKYDWQAEKNVFDDPENDLKMDFWKARVGIDVAFNHRSFIGGDLLRLQAAAEVKAIIDVGVYICPTKEFARIVSPKDGSSIVSYERTRWYLENFRPVLTVPIWLIGLNK